MDSLKELEAISKNPYDYARRWKEKTGRPVIGYMCSYAPEEILFAAGALPLRLFGDSGKTSAADAHLQSYSCSLARGVLADALKGELGFLDGGVFPHTCDTVQRLSDIWRMNAGFSFHADVAVPARLDTENARQYLRDVLARFAGELEAAFGVRITEERLQASISVINRIRGALTRLYQIRLSNPAVLSGAGFQAAVRAAMTGDRNEVAALVEALAEDAAAAAAEPGEEQRKRLFLSGGLCRTPNIYRIAEAAGGVVVDDDMCTGRRFFEGAVDPAAEPFAALARRYADRILCPAKHRGFEARSRHLLTQVRESRAQGVIFFFLKFCDPHGFDYPHLKEALDRERVPSLLLEMEEPAFSEGQMATRIEAFIENIAASNIERPTSNVE